MPDQPLHGELLDQDGVGLAFGVTEAIFTVGSDAPRSAQARLINGLVSEMFGGERAEAIKHLVAIMALAMGYQAEHGDQFDVDEVVRKTQHALSVLGVRLDEFKAASAALRKEAR